jgi:hypothetical protein
MSQDEKFDENALIEFKKVIADFENELIQEANANWNQKKWWAVQDLNL